MIAVLVALGGAAGAVARFVVDGEVKSRRTSVWPHATLLINALGSFLLGLLSGEHLGSAATALLTTGFCGGFTTFSTASVETLTLLRERRVLAVPLYALVTLVLCVGLVALGSSLTS